jgi:mannosylglycoprotein endo-beta-mannosidase
MISRLVSDGGVISDPHALQDHIYTFYRNLMGAEGETRVFSLANTLWDQQGQVSEEENEGLMLSFTGEELDKVLASMRVETAPGPDGWPVIFFKKFWALSKPHILAILNGFALGRVDIARLNFGVLSLIPKVQGADDIRQFRPIALINVIFKFVAKAYAIRVSPIAHRVISRAQSAFIKGRHILEGIVSLQEIIHETKSRKLREVFLKLDFEKAFDRVNWQFLREVLHRKGFDPGWVHRAMSLVSGGQTAITVNGEVGNYFRNGRGVRQGDPLSPLLFDFAVEALAAILQAASRAGHIAGLVPHLVEGGITHLQYADDTIIMLQPDALGLANLKFLLLCFENMSGLRINFHKSEVMVLGSTDQEQETIANLLNCKKGTFPFTYLGLPISDRAVKASDWGPLTTRVGRRADPWMGKFMSSAARLTLINACLSNLPLHAMGVYLLGEGVHAVFRKHRARFSWEANGPRRKYHWVRWDALCKPKSLGGLGIIDTRLMNICLMTKWIWKLYAGEQGLWAEILRNKYLRSRDLLVDSHQSGSQFWNAIQKIKSVFRLGARHQVRSGSSTLFWSDWWQGSGPLCSRFPALFSIAADPQITVSRCFRAMGGTPAFRQSLGSPARNELALLLTEIAGTQLSDGPDIISWALEPSGKFSVKSLYRKLCQGTPRKHFSDIWKIAVPMKIRIFIWQLLRKRLPSNDNIRRRRGPSSGRCALCSDWEDTTHIFFLCPLARFMWSAVRELLGCAWNPTCFAELYRLLDDLSGQTKRVLWMCCTALCWGLWNIRNKFTIEGIFPSQPADALYKMLMYLQVWKPVARRQDREALELAIGRLRSLHANIRDRSA